MTERRFSALPPSRTLGRFAPQAQRAAIVLAVVENDLQQPNTIAASGQVDRLFGD
jgi:hypothetical protein